MIYLHCFAHKHHAGQYSHFPRLFVSPAEVHLVSIKISTKAEVVNKLLFEEKIP